MSGENDAKHIHRSILKPSHSRHQNSRRSIKFDEQNIRNTFHPPDKTYGHDIIDEPKTPFEKEADPVDSDALRQKLLKLEDENNNNKKTSLTFEEKRKQHYNIGAALNKNENTEAKDQDDQESAANKSQQFIEKRRRMAASEYEYAKKEGRNDLEDEETKDIMRKSDELGESSKGYNNN